MSLRTRLDPIDLDLQAIVDEELSPEAQSRQIAAYAREQLAGAQEINRRALGRVPEHATIVDGRAGAPIDAVRPDGTIVFAFEMFDDLFEFIAEMLVKNAPVLSGEYRDSFFFQADGVTVQAGAQYPAADEYVFLPGVPYARKIERGLSDQAPDGVFQVVAEMAARRFGNVARVRFSYRDASSSALLGWATMRKPSKTGYSRRARRAALAKDVRQPAIVVTGRD